jgi:serine/threonine-protein kinase
MAYARAIVSIGRIVADKFALLHELGRGGMGSVWVAEHLVLRSKVAIKLIDASLVDSAEWRARFTREARAAAALRSAHVVQILDHGIDKGVPYIVMELLEGENLATRLGRQGRLSPSELWGVMQQLAKAMTRAHEAGIVHRDLKPDNIFLVEDGADFLVKVLDFGVAKALRPGDPAVGGFHTEAGAFLGTPQYTSPEQTRGGPIDARSDLWAMGVLAVECLTGRKPFEGTSIAELIRKVCREPIVAPSTLGPVPAGFDAWFFRAAERDLGRRFQTARELVDSLRDVLEPAIAEQALRRGRGDSEPAEPDLTAGPIESYPAARRSERRSDSRRPSSIPAGIDGARDLKHVALIQNISRTGALLSTRFSCEEGRELTLNIHATRRDLGHNMRARVVRVERRAPEHAQLWRYDVGVQFVVLLPDHLLEEFEQNGAD